MRDNFTLSNPDAIINIRNGILHDALLVDMFNQMMPDAETAKPLWEHLVERTSNLHGTEHAAQLTVNLARFKRKTASAERYR